MEEKYGIDLFKTNSASHNRDRAFIARPVTLDDAEAMFAYASDKDNTRYTFLTNQNLEETKIILLSSTWPIPLGRWE